MIIESVKLLKTLKAGPDTWISGTVFPNRRCPRIPDPILAEALLDRPTVEILSSIQEEPSLIMSKFSDDPDIETNTTMNIESHLRNKELDSPAEEKMAKTTRSKPKSKAGKPSLAKRK